MTPHSPAAGRLLARPDAQSRQEGPETPAGAFSAAGVHLLAAGARGDTILFVPPGPPAPRPLLVFFHGAGGVASRSLDAVRGAATAYGVLVLLPTSQAMTWDLLAGRLGPDVRALDAALAAVFGARPVSSVAFAGFSDGASYALSLGLANGNLGSAVLAFSPGFLAPPVQIGAPRVWLSHGTADTVLPVDRCGRRVVRQLGDGGYAVHYEEFAGGHVISPELVDGAFSWWLGAPGPGQRPE